MPQEIPPVVVLSPKPWYCSLTIWAALAAGILPLLIPLFNGIAPQIVPYATPIIEFALAVFIVLNRVFSSSSSPITLR